MFLHKTTSSVHDVVYDNDQAWSMDLSSPHHLFSCAGADSTACSSPKQLSGTFRNPSSPPRRPLARVEGHGEAPPAGLCARGFSGAIAACAWLALACKLQRHSHALGMSAQAVSLQAAYNFHAVAQTSRFAATVCTMFHHPASCIDLPAGRALCFLRAALSSWRHRPLSC